MSTGVAIWDPESSAAPEQFTAVLALHKANRATLGQMPDRAFRDRAKHNGLLLGLRDEQIVAYALYDVPRHNLVKLVHLCVGKSVRGSGLARALFDAAIELNPRRSIITATCRTDYRIDSFWRALGMHATSERPGRALTGSMLTIWSKRINVENGLDLLEMSSLESGLPVAVLDTNIIRDLFSPPGTRRDHRDETSALQSDWLQTLVTFAVSGEVDNEINQIRDTTERKHLRAATTHLTRLSTRRPGDRSLEEELLAVTDERLLDNDPSLRNDVLHVADAVHAGADYFVTNDGNLVSASAGWRSSDRGIRVLRPHQLIGALAPESFMSDFRSRLIDDSDLEWTVVTSMEQSLEAAFRVYEFEAKPANFERRLRELLARPKEVTVKQLVDGNGRLWALAAVELSDRVLRLPMLRAIRGERGGTIGFQLVRHFRRVAWDQGAARVEVTDRAISPTIDTALHADGFSEGMPRSAELGPATCNSETLGVMSAADVTLAERTHWPLVIANAGLPVFLIPIQPKWATQLLGLDEGLFSMRRRGLGLSRELVYFSGSRMIPRELPARVLWYESADRTIKVSQIVARSIMIDAARIRADEAVARFGELGVLRNSDIEAAADKDGNVSVIRFQDTERLGRAISRHDEVFKRYVNGPVQSMRSVAPRFFDEILAMQTVEEWGT